MAERRTRVHERGRASSVRRTMRASIAASEMGDRETWLCRSTLGAGSDEEDLWSDEEEANEDDDREVHTNNTESNDESDHAISHSTETNQASTVHTVRRKLSLNDRFVNEHALRKNAALGGTSCSTSTTPMVPVPVTPMDALDRKKRAQVPLTPGTQGDLSTKKKQEDGDDHMAIYVDYEREPDPRPGSTFYVRDVRGIYFTLFMSTATIHSVAFNVSPGLRRLFGMDGLPISLLLVLSWMLFGIAGFVGGCLVDYVCDRVVLLRRASVVWAIAIGALQTARVPLSDGITSALVVAGFLGALVGHGVLVPTAVSLGVETAAPALASTGENGSDNQRDLGISRYYSWCFAATTFASSLVQAVYFLAVNLDSGVSSTPLLRSRRAFLVRSLFGLVLLVLLVVFLYQSRHHRTPVVSTAPSAALERKLATELSAAATLSFRDLGRLFRRAISLCLLAFWCLITLAGTVASLVSHITLKSSTSRSSWLTHLYTFAFIFGGWLLTILSGAGQLSLKSKIFVRCRAMDLPTQPLYVSMVLISLGAVTAFAAFVRAQLYTSMLVQACQLRLGVLENSVIIEPNLLGSIVGVASVVLLPISRVVIRRLQSSTIRCRRSPSAGNTTASVPSRRASIGMLFYVVALFLSGVIELYRRRQPPIAAQVSRHRSCTKASPSNLSILWTVPHLLVLALADGVFRLGTVEEVHKMTLGCSWVGLAQGVLVLADAIGYAAALALSSSLSWWLYRARSSDLVLLLLLLTSLGTLAYALTKRLAERLAETRRAKRCSAMDGEEGMAHDDQDNEDDDDDVYARSHRTHHCVQAQEDLRAAVRLDGALGR